MPDGRPFAIAAARPVLTEPQLLPPSVDFNTPRVSVAAYSTWLLAGLTTTVFTVAWPKAPIACQFTPPSDVRARPSPLNPANKWPGFWASLATRLARRPFWLA